MTELNLEEDLFEEALEDSQFNMYEEKSDHYPSGEFSYQEGFS